MERKSQRKSHKASKEKEVLRLEDISLQIKGKLRIKAKLMV